MLQKNSLICVSVFLMGILTLACSSNKAETTQTAKTDPDKLGPEVSIQTVAAMKGQEGVIVLDVREPSEYQKIHIPGVTLIPKGEALSRKSEYINFKTVFVTCRSGNRSNHIVKKLRAQGYLNVHNMKGGLKAWRSANLPLKSASK